MFKISQMFVWETHPAVLKGYLVLCSGVIPQGAQHMWFWQSNQGWPYARQVPLSSALSPILDMNLTEEKHEP